MRSLLREAGGGKLAVAALTFAMWLPAASQSFAQDKVPASAAAMAEYHKKLAAYEEAFGKFDAVAKVYWAKISEKRRARFAKRRNHQEVVAEDYVLTQPPLYNGPPRPVDPSQPDKPPPERRPIPVVADFVRNALEHFEFVPQRPASELEYKRIYAGVAAAAGLTKDQIVRVYSFESGGNGGYDVQAGLERGGGKGRAISTALGYNQLLHTNSVEVVAEQGDDFLKALRGKAARMSGVNQQAMEKKIAILQRMVHFTRTVPDQWSEHEKLAQTPRGLGVHSITLDIDIGPLAQTQKLLTSVIFARNKGVKRTLTAAELEMMNLTGDGNGFDMVTMPDAIRELVPTSNFFQRSGYERNPVAIRNNTVKALLKATDSRMDAESKLPGSRDMAAAYDAVR
jgi:hypothetical protein